MKKIITGVFFCITLAAIAFGCTYAYLTATDAAANKFTVGETVIEIKEEFTPPDILEPGISFTKKPWVVNTGNLPCYIRMRADFSNNKAEEFCNPLNISPDWERNTSDGYYYYKKIIQPGEKTTPLFSTVSIRQKKNDGSAYTNTDMADFEILIYAEATQHESHSGACPTNEYLTVWKQK